MRARVRVVVRGRVQGVLFRAGCAEQARRRRVGGFVRNLPDGTVEASFEGPEPDVEAMVAWCRQGPALARIDSVEVSREEPLGESSFEIA